MEQKITATSKQNLLDVAVLAQGGLSALFATAVKNGISITEDIEGLTLSLTVEENKKPEVLQVLDAVVKESRFVRALDQQNMLDIALQTSGSLSAVFLSAQANNIAITDDVVGREIKIVDAVDKDVLAFYGFQNIRPASGGKVNRDYIPEQPQGVDYWAIELDFLVS